MAFSTQRLYGTVVGKPAPIAVDGKATKYVLTAPDLAALLIPRSKDT